MGLFPALDWTDWLPLQGAWRSPSVPGKNGLYRIRIRGNAIVYIGQSGGRGGLRGRMGHLRGVFAAKMPYRDPHTAAPALWALRHATGVEFEVSTAVVEGSTAHRKGMESVAIAQHRQEHGCSPAVNFGRMPPGWSMPSGNNRKLVAAGNRRQGCATSEALLCHEPGVAPAGPLAGDLQGERWAGHTWSPWAAIDGAARAAGDEQGFYRIRDATDTGRLLYIGEGLIAGRLLTHWRKRHGDNPQGRVFGRAVRVEASWVGGPWLPHQREELETDLIAAHVLSAGLPPPAQFIG